MTVTGRERHNGQDAWEISLKPDAGRPVWKIWVSAAERQAARAARPRARRERGAVHDPLGRPTRCSTARDAAELVTLAGAHPTAKVVRDRAQVEAALERVLGAKAHRKR